MFCDESLASLLNRLEEELRFVLIVSRASVNSMESANGAAVETEVDGLKMTVSASGYPKCDRCWHHRADGGEISDHPSLCQRCVENIDGAGESRSYA